MCISLVCLYTGWCGHTPQRMPEVLVRLAQAQHHTGLGDKLRSCLLGRSQHVQTLPKLGPPITDKRCEAFGRFDVVRKDVDTTSRNYLGHLQIASVVTTQQLDKLCWVLLLDLHNGLGDVMRSGICKIVSINHCDDDVTQPPPPQRFSCVFWFVGIQRWGCFGCLYGAEATSSCACVSHEHDCRSRGTL